MRVSGRVCAGSGVSGKGGYESRSWPSKKQYRNRFVRSACLRRNFYNLSLQRSHSCSRRSSPPRLPQIQVQQCQVGTARRWPPLSLSFPSESQTPQPVTCKVLRGACCGSTRKRNTEVNSHSRCALPRRALVRPPPSLRGAAQNPLLRRRTLTSFSRHVSPSFCPAHPCVPLLRFHRSSCSLPQVVVSSLARRLP